MPLALGGMKHKVLPTSFDYLLLSVFVFVAIIKSKAKFLHLLTSSNHNFHHYPLKTGIFHPVAILNSTARGTGTDWDAFKAWNSSAFENGKCVKYKVYKYRYQRQVYMFSSCVTFGEIELTLPVFQ